MKKEVLKIFSWLGAKDKQVVISSDRKTFFTKWEEDESLQKTGLQPILAENKEQGKYWNGLKVENDGWLTNAGRIVLLNSYDLLYIKDKKYEEGPQPKESKFFKNHTVIAVVNEYDRLKYFAPVCKNYWQLWYFKYLLKKQSNVPTEEIVSLANFLYRVRKDLT